MRSRRKTIFRRRCSLPRSALERIARETPVSAAEIDAALNLTPWRRSLVVEPLWELLIGERVVRVEGYLSGNPRTTFVRKNEELVDD